MSTHRGHHLSAPSKAQLLLDLSDRLKVRCPVEGVTAHEQQLDKVSGDIATSDVETLGEVWEGKSFIDRDDVSNTVTRIDDNTCLQT